MINHFIFTDTEITCYYLFALHFNKLIIDLMPDNLILFHAQFAVQ